ncbi:hypothetical protein [Bordetella genomosp. 8]|uniref:hypothetical protein n=1 Tax=Bordetella genomosp. 8 TaxID=1416806 RepID=UPI0012FD703D|nr:hypothetical protein [Bordetella genomosp. 8]
MRDRTKVGAVLAAMVLAMLLSGCAADPAQRVNGDAWRHGFSYAGPNYPDTGW